MSKAWKKCYLALCLALWFTGVLGSEQLSVSRLGVAMAKMELEEQSLADPPDADMAAKTEEEVPNAVSNELITMYLEGKASVGLSPDNFQDVFFKIGQAILQKFGGPMQYLQATAQDPKKFAEYLQEKFPSSQARNYVKVVPAECDLPFFVRLSDLSFHPDASTKPPPYMNVAISLLDQYLTNTFLTNKSETPLSLWDGPKLGGDEHVGWTCYLKGAARAMVPLFVAKVCTDLGLDLSVLHPALFQSMLAIQCVRGTMLKDLQSIAIENAQIAARGGIRKQHNCLTWLAKLLILRKRGYAPEEVLKKWNQSAPKETQLSGSKFQALRFLLTLGENVTSELLAHASKFGNGSAFPEDCWANKKLQVNYTPRKEWSDRLRVTEAGLLLAIQAITAMHSDKVPEVRSKCSKPMMEEFVQQAQVIVDVNRVLVEDMGVPIEETQAIYVCMHVCMHACAHACNVRIYMHLCMCMHSSQQWQARAFFCLRQAQYFLVAGVALL